MKRILVALEPYEVVARGRLVASRYRIVVFLFYCLDYLCRPAGYMEEIHRFLNWLRYPP